jgi:hypothetical protein
VQLSSKSKLLVVILIGIFELFLLILSLYDYNLPQGQFGFITQSDGTTIVKVDPDKPAALAGIQAGDRIVYESLPLFGRHILTLKEPFPADATLTLQLLHQGQARTVTLHAEPIPETYVQFTNIISAVSGFVFGIIGLGLVLLRPSRMTYAFAVIAPGLLLPPDIFFSAEHTENIAGSCYDIILCLSYAVQIAGILIFASCFPSNKPLGIAATFDRLGIPVGIFIAVIYLAATFLLRFSTYQIPDWEIISDYTLLLPCLAALFVLINTYATSDGSARSRLAPVIASFMLLTLFGVVRQIVQDVSNDYYILFSIYFLYALAPALVAFTVAYGVIRHRVMDIEFILKRTLVYSILTLLIVFCFAAIEFVVSKLLEGRLATTIEMIASISLGASISYAHLKLDHFINAVFFRRRYVAMKNLNESAKVIQQTDSLELIDKMLVTDPVRELDLASAAIFRRVEDSYIRVACIGWGVGTLAKLAEGDNFVTKFKSGMQSLTLSASGLQGGGLPEGVAQPVLIIPVAVGFQLEAILFYGSHTSGEDIDVDERKSLEDLALSAALAYGVLAQEFLRGRVRELENILASAKGQ